MVLAAVSGGMIEKCPNTALDVSALQPQRNVCARCLVVGNHTPRAMARSDSSIIRTSCLKSTLACQSSSSRACRASARKS